MKDIKKFLEDNERILLALSIFLLVTFTLAFNEGYLNDTLAVLSAGVSYFLMCELISKEKGDETPSLNIFNTFLLFFILSFCVWVMLNLLYPFKETLEILMSFIWIAFIIYIPYKIVSKPIKVLILIGILIIILSTILTNLKLLF